MAEAKKTEEPKRVYVNGYVRQDLWLEFRGALTRKRLGVTAGLEEALLEWLEARAIFVDSH